jgi:hypothetical protein
LALPAAWINPPASNMLFNKRKTEFGIGSSWFVLGYVSLFKILAQGAVLMATAVLSGCIDTHGYGLPFGWHTGNVWRGFTQECARTPDVGAEQMQGFLAQVVQDRHGRAAWQSLLREEKAPLLQCIEVQGNSIRSLCQEAKDCAGVCCEQKRLLIEIHEGVMAGKRDVIHESTKACARSRLASARAHVYVGACVG